MEIWDNLAQDHDFCLTLVDSIPQRCQLVIDAGGIVDKVLDPHVIIFFLFALNRLFFFVLLGRKFISLYIQK